MAGAFCVHGTRGAGRAGDLRSTDGVQTTMAITAEQVKQLRDKTGAGMMECKAALTEANGNMEEAITLLRKRGLAQAAKRAGRATAQGTIGSYIHLGGKIGVLVEVNCESDFVARTDDFNNLVKEVAMHIAAADPKWVRREDVPAEAIEKEKAIYRAQMENSGKPAQRARQDHRGQARQLLLAVRAARSAVDPRRQRDHRRSSWRRPAPRPARTSRSAASSASASAKARLARLWSQASGFRPDTIGPAAGRRPA